MPRARWARQLPLIRRRVSRLRAPEDRPTAPVRSEGRRAPMAPAGMAIRNSPAPAAVRSVRLRTPVRGLARGHRTQLRRAVHGPVPCVPAARRRGTVRGLANADACADPAGHGAAHPHSRRGLRRPGSGASADPNTDAFRPATCKTLRQSSRPLFLEGLAASTTTGLERENCRL